MSNSAINTQVAQQKIGNVQNQADSSAVYSAGAWSFKNASAATSVAITDAGNVGIGTTSPGGQIEVYNSSDNPTQLFYRLSNGAGVGIGRITWDGQNSSSARATYARIQTEIESNTAGSHSGRMIFYTSGSGALNERLRLNPNGSIDIGGQAGYGGLNIAKTGSLNPGVYVWINATATTQKYASFEYNGNGGSGSITPNGTGNVAFNTGPSDYRLKDEVIELSGGLDKIKSLRPVSFKWKQSGESDVGFIAHEIQQIIPQCVNGEKDAADEEGNPSYQSIFPAPAQMIANLVSAIQELSAKVDAQAAEIEALKAS